MQLDHYRIAIRERTYLDILDMALRVGLAGLLPLLLAFAVGILPMIALNAWLLHDLAVFDFEDAEWFFYMTLMVGLTAWEIPLATAPATLVLGQLLFQQKIQPRRVAADLFRSLPQLFVFQVFLRGLLTPLLVTWLLLFASWAHLNEVLLLERNPLRSGVKKHMTTFRRVKVLHAGFVGDIFLRWMSAVGIGALLLAAIWTSIEILVALLIEEPRSLVVSFTVFYPLALWAVIAFFTVVRFLAYVDLRIRREGWEVELLMRAEGDRLRRRLT